MAPQLSGQMVELFEACKQQVPDLERKERVRTQLQQEIQRVYAGERQRQPVSPLAFFLCSYSPFLAVARLYLTGSSMNGLGCRSSDADLCLVIRAMVNIDHYGARLSCFLLVFWGNLLRPMQLIYNNLNTYYYYFFFRKGLILFMYSLPSKGCSSHCVSNYKHFASQILVQYPFFFKLLTKIQPIYFAHSNSSAACNKFSTWLSLNTSLGGAV